MLLIQKSISFFYKTRYLNEEVKRTEPSPSFSIPCPNLDLHYSLKLSMIIHNKIKNFSRVYCSVCQLIRKTVVRAIVCLNGSRGTIFSAFCMVTKNVSAVQSFDERRHDFSSTGILSTDILSTIF
jgi:hypothetical protein